MPGGGARSSSEYDSPRGIRIFHLRRQGGERPILAHAIHRRVSPASVFAGVFDHGVDLHPRRFYDRNVAGVRRLARLGQPVLGLDQR